MKREFFKWNGAYHYLEPKHAEYARPRRGRLAHIVRTLLLKNVVISWNYNDMILPMILLIMSQGHIVGQSLSRHPTLWATAGRGVSRFRGVPVSKARTHILAGVEENYERLEKILKL